MVPSMHIGVEHSKSFMRVKRALKRLFASLSSNGEMAVSPLTFMLAKQQGDSYILATDSDAMWSFADVDLVRAQLVSFASFAIF